MKEVFVPNVYLAGKHGCRYEECACYKYSVSDLALSKKGMELTNSLTHSFIDFIINTNNRDHYYYWSTTGGK